MFGHNTGVKLRRASKRNNEKEQKEEELIGVLKHQAQDHRGLLRRRPERSEEVLFRGIQILLSRPKQKVSQKGDFFKYNLQN